jgi:hypothetical protein
MKNKFSIAVMSLFTLFAFSSCDDDSNNVLPQPNVDTAVKEAFNTKYPTAYDVVWSAQNGYEVADFMLGETTRGAYDDQNGSDRRAEAWFTTQGVWQMTETDIRYVDLPAAVKTAFEASEYSDWRVDDVDRLDNPGTETLYVIDVEDAGTERDLYYSADGILIKNVIDDLPGDDDHYNGGGNTTLPPAGGTMIETDIRYADLPLAVKTAFEASDYKTWTVDDADKLVNSVTAETIYVIDVELGGQERDLYYSADGTLIKNVADDVPGEGSGSSQPTTPTTPSTDYKTTMQNFIADRYTGARIIGLPDYEYNRVEYDIVDGTVGREVVFNLIAEWQYTETEMRRSDVPVIVMTALSATEYGTWDIDDVSFFETAAQGDFYLFEMESSSDQERNVKISTDGTVL